MVTMIDAFIDYYKGDGRGAGVCTLIGPHDEVAKVVEELKDKGIIDVKQLIEPAEDAP